MSIAIYIALLAMVSDEPPVTIDFQTDVRPIFEKKCTPCHFEGGKMYERLPFDQAQTIVKLGTKVFSRIKDEESRAVIRQFLAQQRQ